MYANDEDESKEKSKSDDELGFVVIKEESPEKEVRKLKTLLSQVEKRANWIIDSGCSHHMTCDMNKFVKFNSYDGEIVRVGNNATCHIKGMRSITLNGKTNNDDVYFLDRLKHNLERCAIG